MQTIIHNGHKIEIIGWWKERVYYDGKVVSSKWSVIGSTHVFRVVENNAEIQYEVTLGIRWHGCTYWTEIRREGVLVFTNR